MKKRGRKSAAELEAKLIRPQASSYDPFVSCDDSPAAPEHLSAATREWWIEINGDFNLAAHELPALLLACEA